MRVGAPIETDDSKVETIVGAENLTIALGGGSDSQSSRAYREGVEEFTSCNQFVSPSNQQVHWTVRFWLRLRRGFRRSAKARRNPAGPFSCRPNLRVRILQGLLRRASGFQG